mmetsp:Transcript_1804/g.4016  ORF Transcript_1804/g.4016 Transcript_1804/m.4016 type:complete len:105 (+) Transcript_1804:131-445(+)
MLSSPASPPPCYLASRAHVHKHNSTLPPASNNSIHQVQHRVSSVHPLTCMSIMGGTFCMSVFARASPTQAQRAPSERNTMHTMQAACRRVNQPGAAQLAALPQV